MWCRSPAAQQDTLVALLSAVIRRGWPLQQPSSPERVEWSVGPGESLRCVCACLWGTGWLGIWAGDVQGLQGL